MPGMWQALPGLASSKGVNEAISLKEAALAKTRFDLQARWTSRSLSGRQHCGN